MEKFRSEVVELIEDTNSTQNKEQIIKNIERIMGLLNNDLRKYSNKLSMVETQESVAKYLMAYKAVLYTILTIASVMNVYTIPLAVIVVFVTEALGRYMVGTKKARTNKQRYYKQTISSTQEYINRLQQKLNLTLENEQEYEIPVVEHNKTNGIKPINHEFDAKSEPIKRVLRNEGNK